MSESSPGELDLREGNIFASYPADRGVETIETLLRIGTGRVERIVSFGQSSPEGFWYDQEGSEWVLVLRGRAKLEVEGIQEAVELGPGDHLNLPARTRHRIAWTTPNEPTLWLAIHY